MNNDALEDKIESLKIQLKHLENDYILTKKEYEKSTEKYLEILSELKEKNQKLQDLQKNLENIVEERTNKLKESQNILQERSKELQIMLDSSPAMIFYKDKKNRYVRVNKLFADKIGMHFKNILGKTDFELFPKQAEQHIKDDTEIVYTGKPKFGIIEHLETIYGMRWIIIDKIPYMDTDGNIKGIIGFALDITESKKAEEERKELEEQFFQAQKMESIGRLASGIAHDFNNILSVITGWTELLKMHFANSDSVVEKTAGAILKNVEKASDLTKQLLGFTRKGKHNLEPININEVIKDTMKVSGKIFEKNIKVKYDMNDNIFTIDADKNQLDQVLTNLIINAKDAMTNGGELIFKTENVFLDEKYVSNFPELKSGDYVMISITDTGTGMTKDVKDHIFEPFYTTKEKGTGLGLASVYGIIKNHNGHIICNSKPGKGTTFTIYLTTSKKNGC